MELSALTVSSGIIDKKYVKKEESTTSKTNAPVGFPSPARDYFDGILDLNELMVLNPVSTYFVKVEGHSMVNANILHNDILVIDRATKPENNKIVIACLDGELIVKRLKIKGHEYWLYPENDMLQAIKIESWMDFTIWGVVMWVIHKT
ncbi:MAG: translesion error-prone DNA polymerase V autoproteolytic subunit [Candidatus Cloacimonetes bacterium]|nr:translesion error-prone DNA polymerase V autoproteolytic subunit [Candidatus Cloacimonadota bacterium]